MPSKAITTSQQGAFPDSFKYAPLQHVRTLYCSFVQGLFWSAPVGAYHWDPDNEVSEIYITDENQVKPDSMGIRPAVSFTRGPVRFATIGMDDMLEYDPITGRKVKSVLVPGTMTVNCLSRVDLEAERLAWIIAEQLWANRELLMKKGFFEIGRQPVIGSPSPAGSLISGDSGDELYVVPVQCPYHFYRTTAITPIGAPLLQGIDIALKTHGLKQQDGGAPATAGANLPYSVIGRLPPPFAPCASDVYGGTPQPDGERTVFQVVPHPLNPSQMVEVRPFRPNAVRMKPQPIRARSIPLQPTHVEESCEETDGHLRRR